MSEGIVNCRSCGAQIVWLKTKTGKRMPVDAASVEAEQLVYDPALGHVSHFAACPEAARWRKKKTQALNPRNRAVDNLENEGSPIFSPLSKGDGDE